MTLGYRWPLLVAGVLTGVAAALHVAIILGGPAWYRFFGAGEHTARLAARGAPWPTLVTASIALVLGVWALYAFAGAGLLPAAGVVHVPFLRPVLLLIAAVFLARGVLGIPLVLVVAESAPPQPLPQTIYAYAHELRGRMLFMTVSSAICLGLGVCYAAGALRLRVAP